MTWFCQILVIIIKHQLQFDLSYCNPWYLSAYYRREMFDLIRLTEFYLICLTSCHICHVTYYLLYLDVTQDIGGHDDRVYKHRI